MFLLYFIIVVNQPIWMFSSSFVFHLVCFRLVVSLPCIPQISPKSYRSCVYQSINTLVISITRSHMLSSNMVGLLSILELLNFFLNLKNGPFIKDSFAKVEKCSMTCSFRIFLNWIIFYCGFLLTQLHFERHENLVVAVVCLHHFDISSVTVFASS